MLLLSMLFSGDFKNREEQLQFLQQKYDTDTFQCIIIYGRRRIGKTELIKKFISDKNHIYHLITQEEKNIQLQRMANSVYKTYGDIEPKIEQYHDFFEYFDKVVNQKTIFVLDEFPYLIEQDKSIPSLFQMFIDEYLSKKNILLILCGSSLSMMESMLTTHSPLYGRRTGQIELTAFTFKETRNILSKKQIEDQIQHYAVFGGTPFYLQIIDQEKTLSENIKEKICNDKEVLHEEPWMLLKQEFTKPHRYISILEVIAEGYNTPKKIADQLHLPQQSIPKYLSELQRIRLLYHSKPITQRNKPSRKGSYTLSDPFFEFWFRFIAPNLSDVKENAEEFVNNYLMQHINELIGRTFEEICIECIRELSKKHNLLSTYAQIGHWWHKDQEIDIVGLNKRAKNILFGECKWSKNKVDTPTLSQLKQKTAYVRWEKEKRKEEFVLFSKSGFTPRLQKKAQQHQNIHLYTLKDIDTYL